MKITIKSKDDKEINRLVKSLDMACFLFELLHNSKLDEESHNKVHYLVEEFGINIDELID